MNQLNKNDPESIFKIEKENCFFLSKENPNKILVIVIVSTKRFEIPNYMKL